MNKKINMDQHEFDEIKKLVQKNFHNNESQEDTTNRITTIDENSDDEHYPTAKAVKNYVKQKLPTKTSDLANDSNFITASDLPIKVSQLQNDAGFITASDVPSSSGDSAITKTSQLENDSGFITASDIPSGEVVDKNRGTTIAEIQTLNNDVSKEEDLGGCDHLKIPFIIKNPNVYTAKIYFRLNPLKTNKIKLKLLFFMRNLPANTTIFDCRIKLNNTTIFDEFLTLQTSTAHKLKFEKTLSRDNLDIVAFNTLEIIFNDTTLANTWLDYIDTTILASKVLILNRDIDKELSGLKRTNGTYFEIYNYFQDDIFIHDIYQDTDIMTTPKNHTHSSSSVNNKDVRYSCYYLVQYYENETFYFILNYFQEYLITQDNEFYVYYESLAIDNTANYCVQNVLYAKKSVHNGSNAKTDFACLVLQDFSLKLINANKPNSKTADYFFEQPFQLNSQNYPAEFLDFLPINDYYLKERSSLCSTGYFLLHKSGQILFVPSNQSSYFLKICKGRPISAFYHQDENRIDLAINYNDNIFIKSISRTNNSSEWKLAKTEKVCPMFSKYYIRPDTNYGIKKGLLTPDQ